MGGRDAVFHLVVIGVGHGLLVAQPLGGENLAHKEDVGAQVHLIDHLAAEAGHGLLRHIGHAVLILGGAERAELVIVPAGVEAEGPDELHAGGLGQGHAGKEAGAADYLCGNVVLVDGHRHADGLGGHLGEGVDGAARHRVPVPAGDQVQAIAHMEERLEIDHKNASFIIFISNSSCLY